jgi:hypothetical protein
VVVWQYFPETKGKTLEMLGDELSGKKNIHLEKNICQIFFFRE